MNHQLSSPGIPQANGVKRLAVRFGLAAAGLLLSVQAAQAAVTITFAQSGSDVVATTSGSLSTSGMTAAGYQQSPAVDPAGSYVVVGTASPNNTWSVSGFSGPTIFGTGGYTAPSSSTGFAVGIRRAAPGPWIILPSNYVSGTAMTGTSTYAGTTLAAMGMTAGTYTWSWSGDSITLVVQAPATVSPASQTAVNGTVGTTLSTSTLTTSGISGTVTYSVSPSLPAGLTLNASTGVISGTPTASQSATTYTITATGSTSGTATSSVSIAIAGAAQGALQVTATPGSLRINQTATLSTTGGSGTGAVSYAVTSGSCTIAANVLTAPSGAGTCQVTATKAADASYVLATASVSVTVTARPALAQALDASVSGTVAAHSAAVTRFTSTQMTNVSGHLSQLSRSFSTSGNRMALGLTGLLPEQAQKLMPALLAAASGADARTATPMTDAPSVVAQAFAVQSDAKRQVAGPRTSVWAAGDIGRGRLSVNQDTNRFRTDGITLGVDHQLAGNAIVGLALGYGDDRTSIDAQGSRVKASQVSLSGYGIYAAMDRWVFDGQVGFATASMDNNRYSQFNGVMLASQRRAATWFGALGVSSPFEFHGASVRPHARVSALRARLGAYAESGDQSALAFGKATEQLATLTAGMTVSREYAQADGSRWIPQGRFELRRNSRTGLAQAVSFTDTPSDTGMLQVDGLARNVQALGLGVSYVRRSGMRLDLGLEGTRGSGGYRASSLKLGATMPI